MEDIGGFMKLLLSLLFLCSFSVEARELLLKCEASHNSDKLFSVETKLPEGQRNSLIAKAEEFEFLVTSAKNNVVEIQVYNSFDPSRTYASSDLSKSRHVELVVWRRDSLLEMRCTLIN